MLCDNYVPPNAQTLASYFLIFFVSLSCHRSFVTLPMPRFPFGNSAIGTTSFCRDSLHHIKANMMSHKNDQTATQFNKRTQQQFNDNKTE